MPLLRRHGRVPQGAVGMSGLFINGQQAEDAQFYAAALDPTCCATVQACAGSGKTWLLAARVVRLLLAGAAPHSIVAITFTNKAAAEMRQRIFQWLQELALLEDQAALAARLAEFYVPADALPQAMARAPQLWAQLLAAPQSIAIHTFHSWFLRLKSALPLTDSDAAFTEIATTPALLQADAWISFLARISGDEQLKQRYAWFVAQLGLEVSKAALQVFIARRGEWLTYTEHVSDPVKHACQALHDLHADILACTPEWFLSHQRQALLNITAVLAQAGNSTATNAAQQLANALDPHCPVPDVVDFVAQALLTQEEKLNGNLAKLKVIKQVPAALRQCEEVAQAAARVLERKRALHLLALHEAWYQLGHLLAHTYAQEKSAQGLADFADLELDIARVLQDDGAASALQARLDARVAHLLVDEFQDTNPMQWRILRGWLAGYAQEVDKPSVFIVGDAKQSIYRFRRADPAVFDAAADFFAQHFNAPVLTTQRTRRNAQSINAFVNQVFQHASGPWGQGEQSAGFSPGPFAPQVTTQTQAGVVQVLAQVLQPQAALPSLARDLLTTPLLDDETPALLLEARQSVQHLLALQAQQPHWRWGQVLILVRARASIAPMETALREAGVPYESSRRGGLLEAPEVADIQALCTVLATVQADLALAQVLRSPLFEFTDEDLIALWPPAPATRGWAALQASSAPHHQQAHACLFRWQQWAGQLPVHDVLDRIFAHHDVLRRYAACTPTARVHVALGNLAKVLELALEPAMLRYPSLPRFVQALESFTRVAEDESPDEAMPLAHEAVLITTVHSAKGLERDTVLLFDAHRNWRTPARDAGRALIVWPAQAPRPSHFSYDFGKAARTSARDAWEQEEQWRTCIEEGALLYVALTRAKRQLIISGHAKDRLTAQPSWWQVCDAVQPCAPALQASAAVRSAAAAPAMVHYQAPGIQVVPLPDAQPAEQIYAATLGTAWHALIEQLSAVQEQQRAALRAPMGLACALQHGMALNTALGLFDEALALLQHPTLAPLFAHDVQARSEWPLANAQGELLRIDRAVWLNGTLWVLDFKRAQPQALPHAYGMQLQRYADAVAQLEPQARVRCAVLTHHAGIFEWLAGSGQFQALTGLH
jgi:ATP-dependent helicase/nuclease subunit A